MSTEFEYCDVCDEMIIYGDKPTHAQIDCSYCGTQYKISEEWDSEEEIYNRYLEQV